jgi:Macrocin-O-methyltransferase (TylF)
MSKTDPRPVKAYKDILPQEIPDDRAYAEIFDKIAPFTMTARDGLETTYALFQAIKYICQNDIRGDIVECGVWRGGSMMLIAYALGHFGDTSRDLYLYDTFAGMTPWKGSRPICYGPATLNDKCISLLVTCWKPFRRYSRRAFRYCA